MHRDIAKWESLAETRLESVSKPFATKEVNQQSLLRPGEIAYRLRTILGDLNDFIPMFVLRSDRVDADAEETAYFQKLLRLLNVLEACDSVSVLKDLDADDERIRGPAG